MITKDGWYEELPAESLGTFQECLFCGATRERPYGEKNYEGEHKSDCPLRQLVMGEESNHE